jgi:hypothetical protein
VAIISLDMAGALATGNPLRLAQGFLQLGQLLDSNDSGLSEAISMLFDRLDLITNELRQGFTALSDLAVAGQFEARWIAHMAEERDISALTLMRAIHSAMLEARITTTQDALDFTDRMTDLLRTTTAGFEWLHTSDILTRLEGISYDVDSRTPESLAAAQRDVWTLVPLARRTTADFGAAVSSDIIDTLSPRDLTAEDRRIVLLNLVNHLQQYVRFFSSTHRSSVPVLPITLLERIVYLVKTITVLDRKITPSKPVASPALLRRYKELFSEFKAIETQLQELTSDSVIKALAKRMRTTLGTISSLMAQERRKLEAKIAEETRDLRSANCRTLAAMLSVLQPASFQHYLPPTIAQHVSEEIAGRFPHPRFTLQCGSPAETIDPRSVVPSLNEDCRFHKPRCDQRFRLQRIRASAFNAATSAETEISNFAPHSTHDAEMIRNTPAAERMRALGEGLRKHYQDYVQAAQKAISEGCKQLSVSAPPIFGTNITTTSFAPLSETLIDAASGVVVSDILKHLPSHWKLPLEEVHSMVRDGLGTLQFHLQWDGDHIRALVGTFTDTAGQNTELFKLGIDTCTPLHPIHCDKERTGAEAERFMLAWIGGHAIARNAPEVSCRVWNSESIITTAEILGGLSVRHSVKTESTYYYAKPISRSGDFTLPHTREFKPRDPNPSSIFSPEVVVRDFSALQAQAASTRSSRQETYYRELLLQRGLHEEVKNWEAQSLLLNSLLFLRNQNASTFIPSPQPFIDALSSLSRTVPAGTKHDPLAKVLEDATSLLERTRPPNKTISLLEVYPQFAAVEASWDAFMELVSTVTPPKEEADFSEDAEVAADLCRATRLLCQQPTMKKLFSMKDRRPLTVGWLAEKLCDPTPKNLLGSCKTPSFASVLAGLGTPSAQMPHFTRRVKEVTKRLKEGSLDRETMDEILEEYRSDEPKASLTRVLGSLGRV